METEEKQRCVGVEAALIFESRMEEMLDLVVVVDAPFDLRIKRLQERDTLTRAEILRRINSQMPASEKINRGDYVIKNDGSLDELSDRVDQLFDWLCTKS